MFPSNSSEIIQYDRTNQWRYARLSKLVAQFLQWKVQDSQDSFSGSKLKILHAATYRAKNVRSLQKNLQKKRGKKKRYKKLTAVAIGDLAAARLIFCFQDDLEKFFVDRQRLQTWFGAVTRHSLKKVGIPGL